MKTAHKFLLKTAALIALAVAAAPPNVAEADDVPDGGGGCPGAWLQTTQANHCCSNSGSCYRFFDPMVNATVDYYENQCTVTTHGASTGCCFFGG